VGTTQSPMWKVDAVPEVRAWIAGLDADSQERIEILLRLLERHGPTLGRPYCDLVKGSGLKNMKELRASSQRDEALRILFCFDSARAAILLVGGDKSGEWGSWYDENIPVAEARLVRHEKALAIEADAPSRRPRLRGRKKGRKS